MSCILEKSYFPRFLCQSYLRTARCVQMKGISHDIGYSMNAYEFVTVKTHGNKSYSPTQYVLIAVSRLSGQINNLVTEEFQFLAVILLSALVTKAYVGRSKINSAKKVTSRGD